MSTLFGKRYSTSVRTFPDPIHTEPWMLDSSITYLNHASFGARPQVVYEAQKRLKEELEASPVDFLDRNRDRLNRARCVVSSFLGASEEGFGFVDNATTGVGCVIQSVDLVAGDEILTTNLVYNGVRQLLKHRAKRANGTYREIPIPLPLTNPEQIVQTIEKAITPATRLLVVDHVASSSSIVFPVEEIIALCRRKDVLILVDGAHAPGMLDLSIDTLEADWYVGNLHKWVCAPLGAGFLWTAPQHRSTTHPMTVSHFLGESYASEFNWQGTKDITSWLTAAEAVAWGNNIGWDRIREHNHSVVTWMQEQLVDVWGVTSLTPLDGSMIGSMVTVELPSTFPSDMESCYALRDYLYKEYKIEVPIFTLGEKALIRVSGQLYSAASDIDALIQAITDKRL